MPAVAQAQSWTASYQFPVGDPRDEAMHGIARATAAAGLDIRLFAAGALMRPVDQWAALSNGSVDIIFIPADYLQDRIPQIAALSLPGMIRTRAQAARVAATPGMRDIRRLIEAAGAVILADTWIPGASASRKRCVLNPADARGMRARTIGRYMTEYWSAIGAVPVPATTSETLPVLVGSGLIDIANTSAATLMSLKMENQFVCLTLPGEAGALWYLYEPILVSKRRFDALDEPARRALLDAAILAQEQLAQASSQIERRLAGTYIAAGIETVSYDAETLAMWHKIARKTVWKSFREQVPGGAELLERLQTPD